MTRTRQREGGVDGSSPLSLQPAPPLAGDCRESRPGASSGSSGGILPTTSPMPHATAMDSRVRRDTSAEVIKPELTPSKRETHPFFDMPTRSGPSSGEQVVSADGRNDEAPRRGGEKHPADTVSSAGRRDSEERGPPAPSAAEFNHVWFWRSRLPSRKGERCRVLARGGKNSILVEFTDGYKVITSRYAVRKRG
jgi:hypothetical protein